MGNGLRNDDTVPSVGKRVGHPGLSQEGFEFFGICRGGRIVIVENEGLALRRKHPNEFGVEFRHVQRGFSDDVGSENEILARSRKGGEVFREGRKPGYGRKPLGIVSSPEEHFHMDPLEFFEVPVHGVLEPFRFPFPGGDLVLEVFYELPHGFEVFLETSFHVGLEKHRIRDDDLGSIPGKHSRQSRESSPHVEDAFSRKSEFSGFFGRETHLRENGVGTHLRRNAYGFADLREFGGFVGVRFRYGFHYGGNPVGDLSCRFARPSGTLFLRKQEAFGNPGRQSAPRSFVVHSAKYIRKGEKALTGPFEKLTS